ncbi:hypothetical protein DAI22_07g091700 [Oryza sativa Japonica Group]|nr:hypothetical protein DAI22_07g091700 [Oryza sativa Japonica Group]
MQGGNRSSSPTVSHASFHRLCASPVSALPFAVAAPRRPPPPPTWFMDFQVICGFTFRYKGRKMEELLACAWLTKLVERYHVTKSST